ncbi:polyphosphate polymerase domain-containing protein [Thermoguttaceae bacterium LCP21S3_D4]
MTNFRHEWKHEINPADRILLKSRLQAVMMPDVHGENGYYEIRSLYFDDASDSALRDKIDGINIREKFRIRCYDRNLTMIRLEKKSKINGLCAKESAILTIYDVMRILDGDIEWMKDSNRWLVRQLYERMFYQGLKPKTLVDYRREAYTFYAGMCV